MAEHPLGWKPDIPYASKSSTCGEETLEKRRDTNFHLGSMWGVFLVIFQGISIGDLARTRGCPSACTHTLMHTYMHSPCTHTHTQHAKSYTCIIHIYMHKHAHSHVHAQVLYTHIHMCTHFVPLLCLLLRRISLTPASGPANEIEISRT